MFQTWINRSTQTKTGGPDFKEFEAVYFKQVYTNIVDCDCIISLCHWSIGYLSPLNLNKIKWLQFFKNLKQRSWRVCWRNTFYCKRVLSFEKDFQKWVSADLHCYMKILHFRSVALAFFFACTSFLPVLRSVPIFSPFQQLHSSPCIIVDFLWWICGGLFWALYWLLTCTTVIQLW